MKTILLPVVLFLFIGSIEGQTDCPCLLIYNLVVPPNKYYDTCTATGTFKSKSMCFSNPDSGALQIPYDYYTCIPYGSSWALYPRKCNIAHEIVSDLTVTPFPLVRYFNPYNPATGLCDLKATDPLPLPAQAMPTGEACPSHKCVDRENFATLFEGTKVYEGLEVKGLSFLEFPEKPPL